MNTDDSQIPKEILESEQKRAQPVAANQPTVMGLPPLPANIRDVLVEYGPWLVLASSVMNGFSVAGHFIFLNGSLGGNTGSVFLSLMLTLASATLGVLAFVWLRARRRVGWNMLAIVLILHYAAGLVLGESGAGILFAVIPVLLAAYVMFQIRSAYTK
jgi:hypothetical protein